MQHLTDACVLCVLGLFLGSAIVVGLAITAAPFVLIYAASVWLLKNAGVI